MNERAPEGLGHIGSELQEGIGLAKQVQVVDLIGCEDPGTLVERIQELARQVGTTPDDRSLGEGTPVQVLRTPVVQAEEPDRVEMDKAGYLVILPQPTKGTIVVEHYSYDNRLRRVIEGRDARAICHSIVTNAWMTRLSHAAYLGKELARAELSLSMGFRYVQDGA